MIEELAALASNATPEHRRALLHAVTDLFLVETAPSHATKEHYAGIAERSLEVMAGPDRAGYAERVAASPHLPRPVATRLAGDEDAAVAGLVLTLSPVLTDADLAAIAVTHSQAHLIAIAGRATLSETVTDVLVKRGGAPVLRTVSGNEGAQFSDAGLDHLVERSGIDPKIAANLQRRSERLPAAQAARVLRFAQDPVDAGAPGVDHLSKQARARRLEVRLLLADLKDGKATIDEVVVELAVEDRAFDLAQVICARAGLTSAQVLRALLQPDITGIAIACRAAGITQAGYNGVLALRAQRLALSPAQISKERASYKALTPEVAERALRFLKVRTSM